MTIDILKACDIAPTVDLFCECFAEDHYYGIMFPDQSTRRDEMRKAFTQSISFCIRQGNSIGIKRDGTLVAFLLCIDYRAARENDEQSFRMLFANRQHRGELPYESTLHGGILELSGRTIYGMSIAVDPALRRRGIASALVDAILRRHPDCNFASDVSNEASLEIYRRRNFEVRPLDKGYHLVLHRHTEPAHTFSVQDTVKVAVPDSRTLTDNGIAFRVSKQRMTVCGFGHGNAFGIGYFQPEEGKVSDGVVVELEYAEYLKFQRLINVAQYTEILLKDYVLYALNRPYTCKPLYNDVLEQMLVNRQVEWSLIPDVYVSVPVQYNDRLLIMNYQAEADSKAEALLRDLDFRTHYEAGVPATTANVDDLAYFKQRIRRFYLGKIRIQIASEATLDRYDQIGDPIGASALVDLYISIDRKSGSGVLTWYSLSAPFLLSHLMDNVVRNQVMVIDGDATVNFYDYLNTRFALQRRGTPKLFVVLPREKACLTTGQIASLLASETIYPDGETYGQIIDPEIVDVAGSERGMGQYDRAFVCAYRNVMLQFSPDLKASLRERMYEESIALFYIELILFEEAAIQIADQQIVQLFTTAPGDDPVGFLRQVDRINDEYTNTIDFWNIQVNYPTSQKSINMLREAFRIDQKLECMKRNQEQLQTVFGIKCDIADRRESNRMEKSLAVLSILAIISAWMDSYDYTATWADVLPAGIILILQRSFFVLLLVIGIWIAFQLFGIRRKRKKNTDKKRKAKKEKRKER